MRKHPLAIPSRSLTFRVAAVLMLATLALPAPTAQRSPQVLGRKVYRSPDRTLIATVVTLKQLHSYGDDPSRVEIRTLGGRLLASTDYSNSIGQGYTVEEAAWTADSRFFVYQVSNSGGHSPWHNPVFFYSRMRQRLYSLDLALEALGHGPGTITGGIDLQAPSTLLTKGRYYGKSRRGLRTGIEPGDQSGEQLMTIDLRWLEPRLNRSVEDHRYWE